MSRATSIATNDHLQTIAEGIKDSPLSDLNHNHVYQFDMVPAYDMTLPDKQLTPMEYAKVMKRKVKRGKNR